MSIRIDRAARALQAFYMAVHSGGNMQQVLAAYDKQMDLPDEDATAPECLDPRHEQGWAWWAQKILDEAAD